MINCTFKPSYGIQSCSWSPTLAQFSQSLASLGFEPRKEFPQSRDLDEEGDPSCLPASLLLLFHARGSCLGQTLPGSLGRAGSERGRPALGSWTQRRQQPPQAGENQSRRLFFPLRKLLCPMCISEIHICLTSTKRKQIISPLIKELNYLEFLSRQVCVFLGFSLRRF